MCGIAAIYAYHYAALEVDREELCRIRDAMSRRGPDGAGEWFSADGRVGLGHRRLAIIDLSKKAAQPMSNPDGTVVVSFNGEIYNYRELRAGLEKKGRTFRSQSDTEVLLHLYEEKGDAMLPELRGMFAFALWDGRKKKTLLARDPYGIKPLYYADDGWTVRAASQVKALLVSEKVSRLPEPAGIAGFFLMGSVPEPYTLYQEIRQLPAGSYVWVDETGPSVPKKYFSIASVFANFRHPERSEGSQRDEIHAALLDSIRHHFISDVPVGLFLSSGVDSGALAALAHESGIQNLRTVTLAFEEFEGTEQDEAPLAGEMARRYGTKHTTVCISRNEFHGELPKLFEAMDQPSIDGVNTYFVSRAARQLGWKTALSGVGGDELFGGYPSFREIPRIVSALVVPSRIPFFGDVFRCLVSFVCRGTACRAPTIHPKIAGLLKYGGTYGGAYFLKRGLFMPWELETVMERETAHEGLKRLNLLQRIKNELQFVGARRAVPLPPFARVSILESSFYLRNQLLRDADWAGMAHSLEIRTPFVDAWLLKAIAPSLRVAPMLVGARHAVPLQTKKSLLTNSLKHPLPERVTRRAKSGFSVPLAEWLAAEEGLDEWRRVPALARTGCPWARRWAYEVMSRQKLAVLKEGVAASEL